MKKHYINPQTRIVEVRLLGSVLDTRNMGGASEIATTMYSREERFEEDGDGISSSIWDE